MKSWIDLNQLRIGKEARGRTVKISLEFLRQWSIIYYRYIQYTHTQTATSIQYAWSSRWEASGTSCPFTTQANSSWPEGQLVKGGSCCLWAGLKSTRPWPPWQPSDGHSLGHLSQVLRLSFTPGRLVAALKCHAMTYVHCINRLIIGSKTQVGEDFFFLPERLISEVCQKEEKIAFWSSKYCFSSWMHRRLWGESLSNGIIIRWTKTALESVCSDRPKAAG